MYVEKFRQFDFLVFAQKLINILLYFLHVTEHKSHPTNDHQINQ